MKFSSFKALISRIEKKNTLTFKSFNKSLNYLFLNFNIPVTNNLSIINDRDKKNTQKYKFIDGARKIYSLHLSKEGDQLIYLNKVSDQKNTTFDISVLAITKITPHKYTVVEDEILNSKIIVFNFDKYLKNRFTDFDELNDYFKSNGFQLFSIGKRNLYSLNVSKNEYNNYRNLSLFAIKKNNILKVISDNGKKISYVFRDS
jgi:hypothetical protein